MVSRASVIGGPANTNKHALIITRHKHTHTYTQTQEKLINKTTEIYFAADREIKHEDTGMISH